MHRLEPNTSMALTVQRTVLILGILRAIGNVVTVVMTVAQIVFQGEEHVPISESESHQQGPDNRKW